MNARTALVAVVFLLGLLALAGVLLRPPASAQPESPAPAWLTSLDPTGVRGIRVDVGGGRVIHVVPSPVDGVWTLHDVRGATGDARSADALGTGWPVSTARVRGFVRLIADFAKAAPIEAGAAADATGVVLVMEGGVERRFFVGKAELGGRVRVVLEDGAASQGRLVDANMARLFQPEGLMAWRELMVFPSSAEASTQITLTQAAAGGVSAPSRADTADTADTPDTPDTADTLDTTASMVTLRAAKVEGRWGLLVPVRAMVDEKAPAGVLLLAGRASARRLVEPPPPDGDTGLGSPTMVMRLEQPANVLAGGEVKRRTLAQTLERGWRADDGTSFARSTGVLLDLETGRERVVWGPMVVVIGDEHFSGLTTDPAAWISRVAAAVPVADVRRIVIERAGDLAVETSELTRTVDGWRATGSGGRDDTPIAGALLAWLCTTPAIRVEVDARAPAEGAAPASSTRLRLYGPGGPDVPAIYDFALGVEADDAGPIWRLSGNGVARLYRGPVAGLERAGLDVGR